MIKLENVTVIHRIPSDIITIFFRNTDTVHPFTVSELHLLLQRHFRATLTLIAAVTGPNNINVLDFNTQQTITNITTTQHVLFLHFLCRTSLLAVDYFHARIYDIMSHSVINELLVMQSNRHAVVSGSNIALMGGYLSTLIVWNLDTNRTIKCKDGEYVKHVKAIDSKSFGTAVDQRIIVWNYQLEKLYTIHCEKPPFCFLSFNGQLITSLQRTLFIEQNSYNLDAIRSIEGILRLDDKRIVLIVVREDVDGQTFYVWNIEAQRIEERDNNQGEISSVVQHIVEHDGMIIKGGKSIKVYDGLTAQLKREFTKNQPYYSNLTII